MLEVSGEKNLEVYSGQLSNQPYDGSASKAAVADEDDE